MYSKGEAVRHRYRIVRRDGAVRWVESDVFPVKDSAGKISSLAGMWEDVTDLHQAEAQLRTSLEIREAMLKETHHRIKNSLQVISSLLRLQASSTADAEAGSILTESRNRVEVIALLHEHLYRSDSLMRLNFPVYVRRLLANLVGMHELPPDNLRINLDVDPLVLDTERALVCGLILNELVQNSLRHAFPGGGGGQIDVRLKAGADRMATLSVSDTGVGMPSGFDIERAGTLGLRLVRQLTRQLKGKLSISPGNHLTVQIAFPLEPEA
jgi:two-component sensor histidine kinase